MVVKYICYSVSVTF